MIANYIHCRLATIDNGSAPPQILKSSALSDGSGVQGDSLRTLEGVLEEKIDWLEVTLTAAGE